MRPIVIILILLLVFGVPAGIGCRDRCGWAPVGGGGALLVILLILALCGVI